MSRRLVLLMKGRSPSEALEAAALPWSLLGTLASFFVCKRWYRRGKVVLRVPQFLDEDGQAICGVVASVLGFAHFNQKAFVLEQIDVPPQAFPLQGGPRREVYLAEARFVEHGGDEIPYATAPEEGDRGPCALSRLFTEQTPFAPKANAADDARLVQKM